jgi:hypothetical protein
MKLDDLFEGARDLEYRTLVTSILDEFSQKLRGLSPDRVVDHYPQTIAIYDAFNWDVPEELKPYFQNLRIRFRAAPNESQYWASYQYGNPREYINLYIPVPSLRSVEIWEKTVKANASYWIKRHREMFFHEVIHLIDQHRTDDKDYFNKSAVTTGDEGSYQDYVNSPHEINAYIQSTLDGFEQKLGKEIDPKKVVALSTQELVKFLWYPLSKAVDGKFRKSTWKRFVKRVTQLHNDIKQKYS